MHYTVSLLPSLLATVENKSLLEQLEIYGQSLDQCKYYWEQQLVQEMIRLNGLHGEVFQHQEHTVCKLHAATVPKYKLYFGTVA